jgi:DHA1 family multidrug resistance protein-like MFS transporter
METLRARARQLSRGWATLRENETLLTLCIMMIFVMIGFGMISPVLPIYGATFGVSSALVGMLVTAFGLARLFANLPAGRLADRIGRRPLIIAAPLITAAGAIFAGLAPSFWLLVAARFVQGAGSAIFATAAMTSLADISTTETRGRLMTVFQGSLLIGTSIGPSIGGLTAGIVGFQGVFYVYAVISLVAAIWAYARVKETLTIDKASADMARTQRGDSTTERGKTWSILRNPGFLAVSLVSLSIFFMRTGSRSTIIPLLGAEKLNMSESTIGLVLTVAAVFNVITLPVAGWGIDRFGRKTVIVPSLLVSAFSLFLFAIAPGTAMFFVAAAIMGTGTGIAGPAPAAYVADLARGENYGATLGLFRTISDLGFVVGPVLLGWLADRSGFAFSLYVNLVLLLISATVFALVAKETRVAPTRASVPSSTTASKPASPD